MGLEPYRVYNKVFDGQAADANANSGSLGSAGYSYARVSLTGAALTGTANCTLGVQGSMDGTNWSATIDVATASGANNTDMSAIIDIRCYNHIRLVYLKVGVTGGTFSGNVGMMR